MSSPVDFVHLHLHTEYSLLYAACRLDKLAERPANLALATLHTGSLKIQIPENLTEEKLDLGEIILAPPMPVTQ
jgi:hypothetical protein